MNAKRTKKKNLRISELLLLGLGAVILAAGGIMHVYATNKEIDIARKIDATKKEIDELYADANMTHVKIDRNLDRFIMKEDLLASGSALRETDPSQVEIVKPGKDAEEGIAVVSSSNKITP